MGPMGFIIVALIIMVAYLAYRVLNKSDPERIRNILGKSLWLVDRAGTGGGASYYIQFGKFSGDKVKFIKYGINKEFEYESDLDWKDSEKSLRVGQMKLTLVPGRYGAPPAVMLLNNVDGVDAWSAPLKEVANAPSKKL